MFLNTLQNIVLKNSALKFFHPNKPMVIRHGMQSVSIYRFRSSRDDRDYRNFQELTYGIGASVGIAVVLGVLNYTRDSRDNLMFDFDQMKSKFNVSAAAVPPDDAKKTYSPRDTFNFLADVVEKTKHSVVYIEITARHPYTKKNFPISNGSGFIVKSDGLILTNAHVVNHYGHVIVKLYDGREYTGTVESLDPDSDLATVRIKADNLPILPLGCSADLRPGEFVIAMGNPLTLSHTITAGVVSSANRQGKELGLHKKSDYIQTDAAINVGNSGGPLVNLDGEAIGINTMKVTEGISFAIPSDRAVAFLKLSEKKDSGSWSLLKKSDQQKKHKFLGITMLTLSPNVIKDLKEHNPDFAQVDHGVLVWRVMIGSPSYECGVKPGDVITKINGKDVYKASIIEDHLKKEDVINLTIQRGQKEFEISVPLVETVMPF